MSGPLKVGVKFCGNCNPHILGEDILQQVKALSLKKSLVLEFVHWDSPGVDIILFINGCPVGCAARPKGNYKEVVVSGEMVNKKYCALNSIGMCIIGELQGFLRGGAKQTGTLKMQSDKI